MQAFLKWHWNSSEYSARSDEKGRGHYLTWRCRFSLFPRLGVGEETEETVGDAADGGEVDGVGGVVLDVAAEADDEVVDGAGVGVFADVPDLFEEGFAGDDLAGAVGEEAEEVGLHDGEAAGAVGGDEFEGVEADGAVVEGVNVGRRGRVGGSGGLGGLPCGAAQ